MISRVPFKAPFAGFAAALLFAGAAQAESRSYAVYWFAQASYSQDGDCEGGLNPKMSEQYVQDLRDLGYTGPQIEKLMKSYSDGGDYAGWDEESVRGLMNSRARVNGKPANAFAHPAAVADPHLHAVTGKYAYGFNLDGKGADDPKAFEDPDTHEKGVDNQLFRALGCTDSYRGTLEHDNGFWSFMWMAEEKDSSPAWLITLTGDDLSKDGPIQITFNRAMETAKFNGNGEARADMTYRVDPEPSQQHNIYKGEIKGGVVTITEAAGKLHLKQDQLTYPEFDLKNFHVRLAFQPDGQLKGLLGGYQPLEQAYFALGEGGLAHENNEAPELPGTYWLMRKLADADPDPKTGQNWSISATYHINAVPAFAVPAEGREKHVAGQ